MITTKEQLRQYRDLYLNWFGRPATEEREQEFVMGSEYVRQHLIQGFRILIDERDEAHYRAGFREWSEHNRDS